MDNMKAVNIKLGITNLPASERKLLRRVTAVGGSLTMRDGRAVATLGDEVVADLDDADLDDVDELAKAKCDEVEMRKIQKAQGIDPGDAKARGLRITKHLQSGVEPADAVQIARMDDGDLLAADDD